MPGPVGVVTYVTFFLYDVIPEVSIIGIATSLNAGCFTSTYYVLQRIQSVLKSYVLRTLIMINQTQQEPSCSGYDTLC